VTTPRTAGKRRRATSRRPASARAKFTPEQQFAALEREAAWWGITLTAPNGSGPGGAVTADDLVAAIAQASTRTEIAHQAAEAEQARQNRGPAIHTGPRKPSDITVTDLFCGAGGSTSGAKGAGARVVMASNHWALAVETHGTNHPDTNHDVADISAVNPRRYRPTDILIASPECTNITTANGKPKPTAQLDAFTEWNPDPAAERSRATAWDVFRFAEVHRYNYLVVENVTDFGRWLAFEQWLAAVAVLGYSYRVLSLNSMFFHPCPQSRDRMYVVFWRHGNPEPQLDYCPAAWCPACARNVAALQTWKIDRRTGKPFRWGKLDVIGGQKGRYFYSCPACRTRVSPYYFCALNALDLSIPAEKIGDRLKPRTRERIVFGKRKFGQRRLVITAHCPTDAGRVCADTVSATVQPPLVVDTAFGSKPPAEMARSALDAGRTQTTAETMAVAGPPPLLVHTRQAHGLDHRVRPTTGAGGTQTGDPDFAVAVPPAALVSTNYYDPRALPLTGPAGTQTTQEKFGVAYSGAMVLSAGSLEAAPREATEATPVVTGSERMAIAVREPFVTALRGGRADQVAGVSDELATVCAGGNHHALVIDGAALVTLRSAEYLFRGLEAPLSTQVACAPQDYVLSPHEYLITYNGNNLASDLIEGVPTMRTVEGHGIVTPDEDVDDISEWCFRMLDWTEIRAAMAFDRLYRILGKKREKVKQLGNAVTPPVMEWIVGRCIDALQRSRRDLRAA
jgi:DNA (cytosine-5)-methyltransferase 1